MNIPFLDPKREYHDIGSEIHGAMEDVFRSGWYILGEQVRCFEKRFAAYCGAKYCVGVASGTDAITLALKAAGVRPGDEVITVAHTAVPTAVGIVQAGAVPVFVDIEDNGFCMDPQEIESVIRRKTRAIIPVHLYGHPASMAPILKIAKCHDLCVIEDACQAHGAAYDGKKVGTFGDFAAFSFYPSKNLGAYGDAGAILVKRKSHYERLLQLRNYGQKDRYCHVSDGINSRLDEIQAACLNVKLGYLDRWNHQRRVLAGLYDSLLSSCHGIRLPKASQRVEAVYHLYVIRCLHRKHREQIQKALRQKGIGVLTHYPRPVHHQPSMRGLGYGRGSLPRTEQVCEDILSLPMYPYLRSEEVETIARVLKCQ